MDFRVEGSFMEFPEIDPHGEGLRPDDPPRQRDHPHVVLVPKQTEDALEKVLHVSVSVKPDQVCAENPFKDLLSP